MVSLSSIFKRKKPWETDQYAKDAGAATPATPAAPMTIDTANAENVKAKMDLVLTQIQSVNVRYETLNERLDRMERMIAEIYRIAKA